MEILWISSHFPNIQFATRMSHFLIFLQIKPTNIMICFKWMIFSICADKREGRWLKKSNWVLRSLFIIFFMLELLGSWWIWEGWKEKFVLQNQFQVWILLLPSSSSSFIWSNSSFRSMEKSLTNEEIDEIMIKIRHEMTSNLPIQLRWWLTHMKSICILFFYKFLFSNFILLYLSFFFSWIIFMFLYDFDDGSCCERWLRRRIGGKRLNT